MNDQIMIFANQIGKFSNQIKSNQNHCMFLKCQIKAKQIKANQSKFEKSQIKSKSPHGLK
jgi:hypothetical protein